MVFRKNLDKIKSKLSVIELEELKTYWNCEATEADKFLKWVELIENNLKSTLKSQIPLSEILLNTPSV